MDLREGRKQWSALHAEWAEAEIESRSARSLCAARFRAGEGPTIQELDKANSLEARANELRDRLDEFAGQWFGE